MFRRFLIAGLAAVALSVPAHAQVVPLMPGVTYERQVRFTLRGPVVVHVLTLPRPGGLWALQPALSNEAIGGVERLTEIQTRLAAAAVTAGVNGDLFNPTTGIPAGIVMRGGALDHTPLRARSSIGLDTGGALRVNRVTLLGTWQGTGPRRAFALVNDLPARNVVALYTPVWGPVTPPTPGSVDVVLQPFPRATPGTPLTGTVAQVVSGGNVAIPPDGAVVSATGTVAQRLEAEAPVGAPLTVRLILRPDWSGVTDAIGGGPLLVRGGVGVFDAKELFEPVQLVPRSARSAGQLADGRIVLVTVDGGMVGYSGGASNFELAQILVGLGVVTGAALDGGSAAMAFDGKLLSRPAPPGELPIANALLVSYAGVYAPQASAPVLSPNDDGVAEEQQLSYRLVSQSNVSVQLLGPDGAPRYSFSGAQPAGTYPFTWNGRTADGLPEAEGRWQWFVQATDDRGVATSVNREFRLNLTLGAGEAVRPALVVPRATPRAVAVFELARQATVASRIETLGGAPIRDLGRRRLPAGAGEALWDGTADSGQVVYSGRYVARVTAINALGSVELSVPFSVRKVDRPAPKPQQPSQ